MSSRSTLFYLGLLLVLVAVAYQYRSDITHYIRYYTKATGCKYYHGDTSSHQENPHVASSEAQSEEQQKKEADNPTNIPPSSATTTTNDDDDIYNPPFDPENPSEELRSSSGTRLFTKNELAAHGPNGPLRPILLAVMGRVFDVDKGPEYYGPEGGYKFFAGIDGTRAYVTGEFNEEGLRDDMEGFSPMQVGEIDGWVKFYEKDYTFVGKLIGRYYNKDGSNTKEWYKMKALLDQREKMEAERKELQMKFPGCNSKWNKEDGGLVFCSEKSGGVHRDWVGFPRRYFAPGSNSWRCCCAHEKDLDSPHLKLYPDCDPTSISCKTDPVALRKLKS